MVLFCPLLEGKSEFTGLPVQVNRGCIACLRGSSKHALADHMVQAQSICLISLALQRGLDQQRLPELAGAGQIIVGHGKSVNQRTVLANKTMRNPC